ncbi:hypothetical protein THAOC_12902, partial [Thalassiosira oceanica]
MAFRLSTQRLSCHLSHAFHATTYSSDTSDVLLVARSPVLTSLWSLRLRLAWTSIDTVVDVTILQLATTLTTALRSIRSSTHSSIMNDVESTSSPPEGCAAQTGGASSRTSKKKLVLLSGAAAVVGVAFGLVGYYAADGGGDKAIVRASLARAGRDGGGKGGNARVLSATETLFSARNSRAKSGKVAKSKGDSNSGKGGEICLERGEIFAVEGPTAPIVGPAVPLFLGLCVLDFDPENCPYFYEPFFMQNGGSESAFSFIADPDSPLGDGALCGGKTNDGINGDKFSFLYLGMGGESYMMQSQDLTNLTLGDLESLSYDFSVLDCPTSDADDICPEQFYVNVYLRESIDSANFCDCNMVFSAAGGGEENGGYTTVTVTPFTKVSSTFPCSGNDGCGGKTSLFEYLQENPDAVLGQGGFPTFGAPFQFNVGDTAVSTNGIFGATQEEASDACSANHSSNRWNSHRHGRSNWFSQHTPDGVPVSENAPVEIHKPSWRERREASAERAKKKAELEKIRYFSLDQTQPIAVKDGFVTFTMHFKYLGSFISYNLRDDFDIDTRIKKASMAMGALKHFFNNEHVDTYTKHLIFKAIPLNLLLWG